MGQKADIYEVIVPGNGGFHSELFRDGMGCFRIFRLGRHGWNSVGDQTGSFHQIFGFGGNESWTN